MIARRFSFSVGVTSSCSIVKSRGQDREPLDLLVARALAVDVVDDALHERDHARVARQRRHVAADALRLRPLADLGLVERDERGRVGLAVADDERLGDELRRLEVVLEVLRGDVLAAGGDDDVLLPVGDLDEAVRVDLGDVPRVEPAVRVEHRGRRLGILVVAGEDGLAADQQLAVVRDPELEAGQRRADRAEAPAARACSSSRPSCTRSGRSPRRS